MSFGDAPSALTSYRPGCVGLRAVRKRPGKGQAALRDSVTLAGGWGTPTAQGVSLQTQTRTQEPRILDLSRLPRPRAEAASWLPYFPTENSPGLSGPSARHVETQPPRQQRPNVALVRQLDRASGARLWAEFEGPRAAEPFPGIFNPTD